MKVLDFSLSNETKLTPSILVVIRISMLKFIMTLFLLSNFISPGIGSETWKVTSLNWQPYAGETLKNQGRSVEKLKKLLKKNRINIEVEFYPWNRAKLKAKESAYLGYFPAWPEEVKEGFVASVEIDSSQIGFIKLENKAITYKTNKELFEKYRFGIVESYVYPKELTKFFKENAQSW